jgi:hypothetical protein
MDEARRNNVNRRVTPMVIPKPKAPPPPKPKPPKLSTMVSNKVDSDPSSSSKKVNTNGRGSNIDRLSSVFEDKDSLKPIVAPSLPLSPRLPVPIVTLKKQKSFSREKVVNNDSKTEIDESPLAFGDIKARFQQAQISDGAVSELHVYLYNHICIDIIYYIYIYNLIH